MKRNPFFHFIGSTVLLLVVIGAYIAWYNVVGAESAKVSQIEQQLDQKNQSSAQLAKAKAELASLSNDSTTIDQYFVSTNDIVPFLEQIQATGKYLGSNVQVESVSANPGTPYGTLSLSLSITGSFDAVLRTLGAIEYEPYDTTTNSLTFDTTSGETASSSQPWTANAIFLIGTQVAQPLIAPSANALAPTTSNVSSTSAESAESNSSTTSPTSASTPAPPASTPAPTNETTPGPAGPVTAAP